MPARLTISRASYSKNLKLRSRVDAGRRSLYCALGALLRCGRRAALMQSRDGDRCHSRAPGLRFHPAPEVDVAPVAVRRPLAFRRGVARHRAVISSHDTPGLRVDARMDDPAGAVVLADGELDLETSPMLREAVDEAIARHGRVHVDLRAVTFMDSTGIAMLLDTAKAARRGDVELTVQVSEVVRRVLEVAGVDGTLPLR